MKKLLFPDMLKFRSRYYRFEYTENVHSVQAMIALAGAALLLTVYVTFVLLASYNGGTLSVYFGTAGLLAMFFSIADLILALNSTRSEKVFKVLPRTAVIVSVLCVLCWFGTYTIGIFI